MDRVLEYEIPSEYDGANITTVLKQHFKISTNLIKDLKKYKEGIQVNGEHKRVVDLAAKGDILKITIRDTASENIVPTDILLDIVYEDEDVLVINKPSNMPTHPSMGNYENSLANGVMYYYKSKGEERVFRAVNRLDKDTSGLIIVAKTNKAHEILGEYFKNHSIKREYIALLCGVLPHDTATIDAPIGRDEKNRLRMTVTPNNSKRAITHLQVLKRYKDYTLVKARLETGRTHQIRVHTKYIGYPVYNDPVYASKSEGDFGQFLHSYSMEFIHPLTKEKMYFKREVPKYFKDFLDKLEKEEL